MTDCLGFFLVGHSGFIKIGIYFISVYTGENKDVLEANYERALKR